MTRAGAVRFISQAGLTTLSAILLAAAFPPLEIPALAWIGVVPLLAAVQRARSRWGVLWFYVHSTVFHTLGLWWMTEVAGLGLAVAVFHLGLFQVATLGVIFAARHRLKLPYLAIAPVAWVASEYLRSFLLTGYAWLYLSHTQWRWLGLIQISDFAGAYGVTFLVVAANAALVDAWLLGSRIAKAAALAVPAVLLAGALAYGSWRLEEARFEEGPVVAVVQGNIPQDIKVEAVRLTIQDVMDRHLELSLDAVRGEEKPDLVVWAETMVPGYLNVDVRFRTQIGDLARRHGVPLLVGSNSYFQGPDGTYRKANSAFYVGDEGRILARYDKNHLVPVGEYNPYGELLPRTNQVIYETAGFLPDLSPGEGPMKGEVVAARDGRTYRFAPVICYELIFPELVRSYATEDVDFLVLVTNDAWWRDSFEYEQFLAISVFRAIENRLGLVRCGNTGISAFVEPSGAIREEDILAVDGKWKNVQGVLVRPVAIDSRRSFYRAFGDVFAKACLAALVVLGLVALLGGALPRRKEASA